MSPSRVRVATGGAERARSALPGPEVLHDNLRRSHLVEGDLWPRLRLAGIADPAEVGCVVPEPTGGASVFLFEFAVAG